MSKKIIIVFIILVVGGYFILEGSNIISQLIPTQSHEENVEQTRSLPQVDRRGQRYQTDADGNEIKLPNEPLTLEELSEATPVSGMLDFNDARRFDSIEEIGEIRFTMTVGEVYTIQKYWEYSYHGIGTQSGHTGGRIHIKDSSDPEINKGAQPAFLLQVGNFVSIGFVNVEGRHYSVTILEIKPTVLKLRIEEIKD